MALHTNTWRKHKAHLFDSLIPVPQGEWKEIAQDSHRFCGTDRGWTETRQMGSSPRQEIAGHNSMKLNQFVQ